MNSLSGYIPQDRRHALLRGVPLPDRASGTAMFADVTGFTPLAEALAMALGPRRGAEELTALLNRIYGALIAEVERFGGSVISFSGDAMTCWFDDTRFEFSVLSIEVARDRDQNAHLNPQHAALGRAVACALAMRRAMAAFAAIPAPGGPAVVTVKVSLASGPVRRFQLGDEQVHVLDVLAGRMIDRLAAVAQLAERDDVLVDADTLAEIASMVRTTTWREDPKTGTRAASISEFLEPLDPEPWPAPPAVNLAEGLVRPWLHPAIYDRLRGSAAPFLAELRPAIALMLQFGGLNYDEDEAGILLDTYIRKVQRVVMSYEGILVDVTMADKGGYLYAAFGAPVAHEDDAARALRAALELRDLPVTPHGGSIRIGLSQGTMRTGPYGGDSRCTYGVLGDEVNLACRLMSAAAPEQILASGRLQRALLSSFHWSALPAMRVRGKATPVEVYRLLGEPSSHAARRQAVAPGVLVGRAAERAALADALEGALAGAGSVVIVEGDPGIGKSCLIAELTGALEARGAGGLAGAGRSIEQQTAYRAWRDVFTSYFELDELSEPSERQARVLALAEEATPEQRERLPLLNDILNLELPDTALTASLSAGLRSESLDGLLVDLLRARAAARPLVLVLDDAHWLDSRSWALAVRLARTLVADRLSLLLVIATRRIEAAHAGMVPFRSLLGANGVRWLRLGQLGEADTIALAAARLGLTADEMPTPVVALLHERAGGNPFFAEELAATLREQGLLRIESDSTDPLARPRCTVVIDLQQVGRLLPATLEGLLLARIDGLPPEVRMTLKVASVVGPTFAFAPLHFARSRHSVIEALAHKEQLRTLAAQDYTWLEEPEPTLAYCFKHILTQEAAYETLLYAQRRALHLSVAEWYEETYNVAPHYPLLAHHYRRAESPERERHYAWLAGVQAAEQYANAEAVAFFTRALELTPEEDAQLRWHVIAAREQVYDVQAAREAQAGDLQALEDLAIRLGDGPRRAEAALRWASYYNHTSDYPASINACRVAIDWAHPSGDRAREANAYLSWGRTDTWRSNALGSYPRLDQALRLAREIGLASVEAEALRLYGINDYLRLLYASARTCYEQALQRFRDTGDRRGEVRTLNNIGVLADTIGAYAEAYARYEQALRLCREIGDRWFESALLTNIGNVAADEGDYGRALPWFEQAEQICHQTDDRHSLAVVYHDRGTVWLRVGQYAAAREQLSAALALFQQMGYQRDSSDTLNLLGFLNYCAGDAPAAEPYARESLAVAQETEFVDIQAAALCTLGCALEEMSRPAEAAAAYAEALRLDQQGVNAAVGLEIRACSARVTLRMGQSAEAQALVEGLPHDLATGPRVDTHTRLRIFLACYQIASAAQDARARPLLEEAYDLLQTSAARIGDETLRRSFLEQVPAHRAIMAEYENVLP